jgi:hypothetical protein
MDPHKAFRMAVYDALNSNLTDLGNAPVAIFDEVAESPTNAYVLLSTQTSAQRGTFGGLMYDSTILLQVIDKETIYVSKEYIDDVGDKITSILLPAANSNGLVQQTGFQINCLRMESVNTNDAGITNAGTIVRKLLRLSAVVCQTSVQ